VIALYRRHVSACKYTSRKKRSCRCPIWAEGTVHGTKVRRSLDLSDWEAAVRLIRQWEIHAPEKTVAVEVACNRFIADAKSRKLREGSILKYEQSVKMLKEKFGTKTLRMVTVDDLRSLRESWEISALTMQKRLETVRAFFNFCMAAGWIDANPAESVKGPVVRQSVTLPFEDEEIEKIFEALEIKYLEAHPFSPELTKRKLKAFILVMLYGGIRISDCVLLRKERIRDGKLFITDSHKTGVPIWVPLPEKVLQALDAIGAKDYYFSTGAGKVKTWTTEWEERLKKVFVLAGLPDGHSHQLRDTFSVRLLRKGVPLDTVAALLGNTVKVVEKHYNPWVKVRQEGLEESVRKTWDEPSLPHSKKESKKKI
jgi:integrase